MMRYIWWYLHISTGCVLNKASHPQLHATLIKKDPNETRRLWRCESCDFACFVELDTSPESCGKTVNLINTIRIHSPMFDDFWYIYLQSSWCHPPVRGQETPGYDPPKKRLLGMWNPKDLNTGLKLRQNGGFPILTTPWLPTHEHVYIYIHTHLLTEL